MNEFRSVSPELIDRHLDHQHKVDCSTVYIPIIKL